MKAKIAKPKKFQQNHDVKQHFHPRGLARGIVHRQMAQEDMFGVNKVRQNTTHSQFSAIWRIWAEKFADDREYVR